MPIIHLEELSKIYGFGNATTLALDEVSLSVEEGEFVAVMGPSGSGKSTLMHIIGLLDHPSHGDYRLNGRTVARLKPTHRAKARRDTIGFVFQSFNLLPRLNILENVALPLTYKGVTKVRRLKRAGEMLERVGLSEKEYFLPHQLSGGEAQRVAIARALINNPTLIIADEPTGNLDSASSRLVMELLSDLHKAGTTILIVTHNPALTRYASRVVFMRDGSIIADETSTIGEIPDSLRRSMYFMPRKTAEDDLAGVSALMKAIPDKEESKKATKTRAYRARPKTKRGKR
jgi:putative ABC transport system ATP-binding protein